MNNKELETIARIGKLDSLLLFAASLATFAFSVIQWFIGGVIALVYGLPLLLIMLIMPVWIGFIRGAILENDLIERIRGFIYLIIGSATYGLWTLGVLIIDCLPPEVTACISIAPLLLANVVLVAILMLLLYFLEKRLEKFFRNVYKTIYGEYPDRDRWDKAIRTTGHASILLGAGLVFVSYSIRLFLLHGVAAFSAYLIVGVFLLLLYLLFGKFGKR